MKYRIAQFFFIIWSVAFFTGCTSTDVTTLLSTDDCGPRPDNYKAIAAEWLNKHNRYTPPNPIKPNELSTTEPTRVATIDQMHGRTVGWQIIFGPENKAVRDYSDARYTRMIINHGRIVSVTSDNQLSAFMPPAKKKKHRVG